MCRLSFFTCGAVLACCVSASDAQLVRSGAGADPAAIQAVVDQFRADLGTLNPNVVGSAGSGRREINWDGVPDGFSSPNVLPGDFFNVNSPRGALLATPGTSLQVSADSDNPTSTAVRFGHINPTYPSVFQTFSAQRLFSPLGSNIVDLTFRVPGTNEPALSRGFGAVYADVDLIVRSTVDGNLPAGASFELFGAADQPLGTFSVPAFNNGLSFLGVSYATPTVSRLRITYGNAALGPDDGAGIDVSVMDDFIYGEPVGVPEPASLIGVAIVGALAMKRRR